MPLFTVTTDDGTEVEVSESDLPDGATYAAPGEDPDGFISEKRHEAKKKEAIEDAVQERLQNHVRKDQAAQNQDVIDQVLEEHGEDIDLDAKKQEWRQEWEEEELEPREEKLQSRTERMKELALQAKAQEAGVEEEWLSNDKKRRFFIEDVKDRVEYDPEHGDEYGLVGLDPDGEKLSGGKDKAYAGVSGLFGQLKEEEGYSDYFGEPSPQGGGGASPGGGGSSKEWREKSKEERAQELNQPSTSIPTG